MPKTVGVAELKARLSKHLRAVQRGETLVVTEHGRPVAKLSPLPSPEAASASPPVVREPTSTLATFEWPRPPARAVDPLPHLLDDRRDRLP